MKNLGLKNNTKDIANLEDIKTPSNMVTTDSAQTISGAKTFTKTTTFQNDIKANGSAGTLGQVLISQGSGNSPKWGNVPAPSNVVTTDTAQTITGTKTFSNIQITGDTTYQDARLNFENANGAQQTLLTNDLLSSSVSTSFTLPSVIDSSNTYELGTALYNHCVIVSGTNCYATFNVLCNRSSAFTSIEDICNTVIAPQEGGSSLVFHIAASGRVYGSSISTVKIVDYVELTSGFIRIHYLSLSSTASGRLEASFVNDSVLSCNLTHK